MSDAELISIAKAVLTDLNAATLSQSFTATRAYRPPKDLKDVKTLAVLVVPGGVEGELLARGALKTERLRIDIAVIKQVDPDSNTVLDALAYLVQEVKDTFFGKRLSSYTSAACIACENSPAWEPDILAGDRCFVSITRLYFRVDRT